MASYAKFDVWQDTQGVTRNTVLQVLSSTKTDIFTTTSTSYVDIPDLSVIITPYFSTSKILVTFSIGSSHSTPNTRSFNLVRNSTNIAQPDSGVNGATIPAYNGNATGVGYIQNSISYLDSPNSVVATTYKIQVKVDAGTGYINRHLSSDTWTGVSSITVMEIAQ